jgi:hypothetical protein
MIAAATDAPSRPFRLQARVVRTDAH